MGVSISCAYLKNSSPYKCIDLTFIANYFFSNEGSFRKKNR